MIRLVPFGGAVGEPVVDVGEQFGRPGAQGAGEADGLGDVEGGGVVVVLRGTHLTRSGAR